MMGVTMTWEELDLPTPDEIAAKLRAAGVKGVPADANTCPLACATGWKVWGHHASHYSHTADGWRDLTLAQTLFVHRFDNGYYLELLEF